jgi:hypothetical protein
MEQLDASGYLGSVTVATQPSFSGAPPAEATPDSICATAESFVGKAWNENGCWVLASTIAAEAGASLPVVSSMIGVGGQNNGEWFVAFDGSKQTGNWESLVKAGEIIVIGSSISGHITTCVAGSGSSAQLIDNVTYVNNAGAILNPANDGSSSDIIVSAAHAASQEWSGVNPADVVIYELDAPVVSTLVSADNLAGKAAQTLAALFSAKDPEGKTLNEYQVFDTASTDSFTVSGTSESAHSAGTAITVTSLSAIALQAGSSAATDTVEVRAFNGSYWGDWETLQVSVGSATAPPTIANQTAAQTWTQGQHVALTLPTNTFADPNGESLQLTANLSNGQPLPSWLSFTAASGTFSGIVPASAAAFGITVTATDTSGLSVSESFGVTVPAAVLKLATQTANQSWIDGQNVSFKLPSGTFIDPQGLQVSYAAYETSGISVTSWLSFNPTTETFSGKVPANANGIAYLEVIATDSSGAIATDAFAVSLGKTAVSLIGISQPSTHGIELLHG